MSFLTQLAYTSSDTYYYESSPSMGAAELGIAASMIVMYLVLVLVMYVFFAVCLMAIFKKAGRSDAWAAWVPVYNYWVLAEVAGRPGWWGLGACAVSIIPFVGPILALIVLIILSNDIAKSFGHGVGFTVLLVLLPIVGYPMLAFGGARYVGPAAATGAAPAVGYAPQPQTPTQPQQGYTPVQPQTQPPQTMPTPESNQSPRPSTDETTPPATPPQA